MGTKKTKKKLLPESEARFRHLATLGADVYWQQDDQYRVTHVSGTHAELVTQADWAAHRALLEQRLPFRDLELRIETQGRRGWLAVSGEPIFDARRVFRGYHGVGRDITERKHAEQCLRMEHGAALRLAEATTLSDGVEGVLRTLCEEQGWDCGRYFALDESDDKLRLQSAWHAGGEDLERFIAISAKLVLERGQGLAGRVLESGEALWAPDVRHDARIRTPGNFSVTELLAEFQFPVLAEGRVIGVVSVSSREARAPDERLAQALRVIGNQLGQFVERKRAEAARVAIERRLAQTFELAGSGIAHLDLEARFLRVNPRLCAILGYPESELVGRSVKEISHPDDRDLIDAQRGRLARGEVDSVHAEKRYVRKDATIAWTAVTVALVRDEIGKGLYEIAVFEDVSERRRAQSELRASEARFRSLTNLASDWYWEQDTELRFTKLEGNARERYMPTAAVLGRRLWELPNVVKDEHKWAALRRILEAREPFRRFEYSYVDRRGQRFYMISDGEPVFDEEGRFAGYRGTTRDITEQRRGAEALRRFRTAMDMTSDAIFLTDRATMRFLDANGAACRSTGYTREQILGMHAYELLPRDPRELANDFDGVVAAGQREVHSEATYLHPSGRKLWIELQRRAVETAEGSIIVTVVRDITERKRAEERQAGHLRHQERVALFGQAALAMRDVPELIAAAVTHVLQGLRADGVAYLERGSADGEVLVRALEGVQESDAGPVSCAADDPIYRALLSGERFSRSGQETPFRWARGMASIALVPVRDDRKVRGAFLAVSREPEAYVEEAFNFMGAMASVLAAGLQRIESEQQLAFLAQFDALTGLPNRALLADRFSQMIVQAGRRSSLLGVLFVDLDEFKLVNDSLGHAAGDALLKEVALRLQQALRPGDTVARIAGDEFAVLLGDLAQVEHAGLVAQKLIERFSVPFRLEDQELFVTSSIGIAAYPADGQDAETLLAAADAAMYRAKQSGRNTYQFFTADINQRTRARALLNVELHRALDRGEFRLIYQPKIDLKTNLPCGAEALLRWNHPERGIVAPVEFIPALEDSGLIVQVGEWVLRQACEDIKRWQALGARALPVAVNLSARQFRQQDLDERIRALLAAAGVDAALIEVEITESQLMHDPDHAIRIVRSLAGLGIRVAIDDFGTGYSSLAYLTRFPVAALKIDRSFVFDALRDPADATIVRTIVDMAHTLGFEVIAEGVENAAHAAFLRGLGCEMAQGFYFARPMPADELFRFCEEVKLPG